MKAYRINCWHDLYENNKSREIETLTYFCQPNKIAGEGVGFMLMQPDGLELYGLFGFIKILASTAPKKQRGWLIRNGTALTPERMEALTRIPKAKWERALTFFSTPPMDWMTQDESDSPTTPRRHTSDSPTTPPGQAQGGNSPGLSTDLGLSTDSREREKERTAATVAEIEASRTQAGILLSQIRELAGRKGDLTLQERADLRKKRAALAKLQEKQAGGDFRPTKTA